jgi:hypothetical protein
MKRSLIIVTGLALSALAPAAAAQSPDDRNVYRGMDPLIVDAVKANNPEDLRLLRETPPPPDFVDRYVARESARKAQLHPDDRALPRGTTPPPDFVDRYVARTSAPSAQTNIHPDDRALPRATPVEPPTLVRVSDPGFDWTDFGVGAIGGFGIALSLTGAALLILRRSVHREARAA